MAPGHPGVIFRQSFVRRAEPLAIVAERADHDADPKGHDGDPLIAMRR